MKTIIKNNIACLVLLVGFSIQLGAQNKVEKLTKRFTTDADVAIHLDTRYTNLIFETWNKNEVEVEAYVTGKKLTKQERDQVLEDWNLQVNGAPGLIRIVSKTDRDFDYANMEDIEIEGLDEIIAGSLRVVEPIMNDLVGPLLEGISGAALPDQFYDEIKKVEFDYERYRKEGDKYLKEYERKMEKSFGKDFDEAMKEWEEKHGTKMAKWGEEFGNKLGFPKSPFGSINNLNIDSDEYERNPQATLDRLNKKYGTNVSKREMDRWLEEVEAWGEQFGKRMEDWGEQFGSRFEKSMEAWGEEFGEDLEKSMEAWGENFGKSMEKWGEEFGKKMEKWAEEHEGEWERYEEEDERGNKRTHIRVKVDTDNKSTPEVERTIIVRMPKNAELDLDVRHGKVKMAEARNAKVDISHGELAVQRIDGGETFINAAYTPVSISQWNAGTLHTSYIKNCVLNQVRDIALESNSSDVRINNFQGRGMITGTFGELRIPSVGDSFESLSINLENSDMALQLPDVAFNFSYSGQQSSIRLPKGFEVKEMNNGDSKLITGSYKKGNNSKMIAITARYTEVILNN
ncbi:DUF4097 family beta strand repeat-containing protein [Croceiramulus getboli]|nr:DUF4097 family beta strand repeat-containing protein [Flavobacteriaceae bacterium YJPT1-3]